MKKKGFFHAAQIWRAGRMIYEVEGPNLIPTEGEEWAITEAFINNNWYIALIKTDITIADTLTYANTMGTTNDESTDYSEVARQQWSPGSVTDDSGTKYLTNSASPAVFTMGGTDTTIYASALVSSSSKGDMTVTETLISIYKWAVAASSIQSGDELRVIIRENVNDDGA